MKNKGRLLQQEISALGPRARAWAESRCWDSLCVAGLCSLGKSALDGIPHGEAQPVAFCILSWIRRLNLRSNRSVVAGAGMVLSEIRSLFKTFDVIESASEKAAPAALLAALGSSLPGQEARALLAYLAELPQLDEESRMLAREGRSLNHRLVFDALRGQLPQQLSAKCSPALREDWMDLQLMLQERPKRKAASWWLKLSGWRASFRLEPVYSLVRVRA